MTTDHVVVVGAGVSGLTTAIVLAEAGKSVHVIAAEMPGITSLAAGAMWGPYLVEPRDKAERWSSDSLRTFQQLAADNSTGVRLTSGTEASRAWQAPPEWAVRLPGFRLCAAADLPSGFVSGYRFAVPLIDMPVYLSYLHRRLTAARGTIEIRAVDSFQEARPADVIVNCAGLVARSLVPDDDLRPIRGQHVVMTNPGITEFFSEDTGASSDLLCIYPQGDKVVLGGTALDGDESMDADDKAAEAIIGRCTAVEPRLTQAHILGHRIGLRPTRHRVRVEADQLADGTPLLHNYGHGGAGVTLSWGCAREVLSLIDSRP